MDVHLGGGSREVYRTFVHSKHADENICAVLCFLEADVIKELQFRNKRTLLPVESPTHSLTAGKSYICSYRLWRRNKEAKWSTTLYCVQEVNSL